MALCFLIFFGYISITLLESLEKVYDSKRPARLPLKYHLSRISLCKSADPSTLGSVCIAISTAYSITCLVPLCFHLRQHHSCHCSIFTYDELDHHVSRLLSVESESDDDFMGFLPDDDEYLSPIHCLNA